MPYDKTGRLRWAEKKAINNMEAGKIASAEGFTARPIGELLDREHSRTKLGVQPSDK